MSKEIEDESTHVTVLHATVLKRLFYRIKLRKKRRWMKNVGRLHRSEVIKFE